MEATQIESELKKYILETFVYAEEDTSLASDVHLFDNGIIDSTGVLELVGFLEEQYEVEVADTEMLPENFETIAALTAFVQQKQNAS
ncbi:MAG: acyl carrier protein [Deltaproteobacteria bacterium]|nr:acyl carrier protein [Deltaproteobacteria bacterium]